MTWETSEDMARCLVGYLDNRAVQRALMGEFRTPITLTRIEHIRREEAKRAEQVRRMAPIACASDNAEYKDRCSDMAIASARFAEKLWEARG